MESRFMKLKGEILPLPEDQMPSCWWNQDEISYLFSPFRSFTQNPLDKESKLKFWRPLIRAWCIHHNRCTFTLPELEKIFQRDRLVPACLPGIIEELLRNGELGLKRDLMQLPSKSWSGWAFDVLVKRPVSWSWKKAKDLAIASKVEQDIQYVHLAATKFQGEALLAKMENDKKGRLLSQTELEELCGSSDIEILIQWLLRQGKVAVAHEASNMLVKFAKPGERATEITEADKGVYALRHAEQTLMRHLEELEAERSRTIETARAYVAKGMRQMAKTSLRKKHELEKCMEKRAATLDNIQVLLSRVREAESDSKILESYQLGVSALKLTFKDANLTEDTASSMMLQVEEMLDVQDEIQASLAQTVGSSADEDLEDELSQLLLADTSSTGLAKDAPIEGLPSPPTTALHSPRVHIPDAPTRQLAL